MTIDATIAIVSFNSRRVLERCLESLFEGTRSSLEVYVVDNASRDGTPQMVRDRFPQARVICNRDNVGFAAANNQALSRGAGRHLCLLNPDVEVANGAVDLLIDFLDRHPWAGAVGPRVIDTVRGSLFASGRRSPTAWDCFLSATAVPAVFPRTRLLRRYLMGDRRLNGVREVEVLSGACMMVRREAAEQVGLLDECFFLMYEDIDWCDRLRAARRRLYVQPAAVVVHEAHQSTRQTPALALAAYHDALRHYLLKHRKLHSRQAVDLLAVGAGAVRAAGGVGFGLIAPWRRRAAWADAVSQGRFLARLVSGAHDRDPMVPRRRGWATKRPDRRSIGHAGFSARSVQTAR
jgi:GT2 family glycosyltransferase